MSKMSKVALLSIFDAIIGVLFVASNWWIWDYLEGKITTNAWGPFQVAIVPKTIVNGEAVTIGTYTPIPNYPFILFWVALAVNFIFLVLALNTDKKQ